MNPAKFILVNDLVRQRAIQAIKNAPLDYVVRITESDKSRDQECKYHAMCGDIAKQLLFSGERLELEDWKRILVDAFVRVMREEAKAKGDADPFANQGRTVPSLDGSGYVQLGVQTRKFKKAIASQFIEYLYSFGSENKIRWSEASQRAYQELRKAA